MTQIGFILVFRNKATHIIKIKTITHFVLTKVTVPFPQKAVIRIKIPADAIIATTAEGKRQTAFMREVVSILEGGEAPANAANIEGGEVAPSAAKK